MPGGGLERLVDDLDLARTDLLGDQLVLGAEREVLADRADEVAVLGDRDLGARVSRACRPCCGIPASSVLTVACAFLAAGAVGLDDRRAAAAAGDDDREATTTTAMAPTTTPPSMRSRRLRRARSARACSSASRRCRAASFCSLREAMPDEVSGVRLTPARPRDEHSGDCLAETSGRRWLSNATATGSLSDVERERRGEDVPVHA